jgi:hypothetical protein
VMRLEEIKTVIVVMKKMFKEKEEYQKRNG